MQLVTNHRGCALCLGTPSALYALVERCRDLLGEHRLQDLTVIEACQMGHG